MKCVVVGGGGFIGSHLSEALLASQHDVIVFDRSDAPNLEMLSRKGATILIGSILEPSDLKMGLAGADRLFHLASTTVPKSSIDNPIFDVETNLISTINMLNIARDNGVKKVVFASSGGTIYGIPREIPINEAHPTNPISSYGIIKLAIEKYLGLFWALYGLDYCILRISNAFGERQPVTGTQGIIPTIIERALNHDEIHIWGDGNVIRDYIHVSDIIESIVRGSEHSGDQRVFNIGSGVGHSVNDILTTIEAILGEPLKVNYEHGRPFDVPVNILDISLAKQVLRWEPKTNLREGIRKMLNTLKSGQ